MNSFEQRWNQRWDQRGTATLRLEESTQLSHPPDRVWALLTAVEQAPVLAPASIQRAFLVPGTPDGVGQQQCCVGPDGSVSIMEVVADEPPRRGAARQVAPPTPVPVLSTYDLAPTDGGCRVTLGIEVDHPADTRPDPAWEQLCRRQLREVLHRLRGELDRRHPPDGLWTTPFDEAFIAAAPAREQSGAARVAAARRISADHGRAQPWRGPAHYGSETRTRRAGRSALIVLAVSAALVIGVTQLSRPSLTGAAAPVAAGDGSPRLPRPADAQDVRLLPPVTPPAGTGGYELLHQHLDRSVSFDPCQPVHWVVRAEGAPVDAMSLLSEAFTRLSAATGLVFVHDGLTDESYDEDRPLVQADRYGERYAPVLVVWSSEQETEGLSGDVGGFAGPVGLDPDGAGPRYVSGAMVLDAPQLAALQHGWPAQLGVVLHELGHLVGLDHVDDPADTMHANSGAATTYSLGALRGLAVVGNGPCFLSRS